MEEVKEILSPLSAKLFFVLFPPLVSYWWFPVPNVSGLGEVQSSTPVSEIILWLKFLVHLMPFSGTLRFDDLVKKMQDSKFFQTDMSLSFLLI